jgi:uncharacterized membrane protein
MLGLTPLGVVHTAIGLVALASGLVALIRDRQISPRNLTGKIYVITTVLTCLTGFGIFQHHKISPGHILGAITLATLGVAALAGAGKFGSLSKYVETVSYSATFLFNMIPGVTETTTRLPLSAPLVAGPDAPALQMANGALLVLFLIGATLQVIAMRRAA